MKKTFIFIFTTITACAFAQVAIGKSSISSPNNVSLEFGVGDKGIVLPWVNSAAAVTSAVNGTIIYDTTDKKVKYLKNNTWFDLSIDSNGAVNTSAQDALNELDTAKVVIGKYSDSDTTPGILILSDTDKAMVLPKVAEPHLNIKNPAAGMMVYDTTNRQLAVFNGTNWSFWKP